MFWLNLNDIVNTFLTGRNTLINNVSIKIDGHYKITKFNNLISSTFPSVGVFWPPSLQRTFRFRFPPGPPGSS